MKKRQFGKNIKLSLDVDAAEEDRDRGSQPGMGFGGLSL